MLYIQSNAEQSVKDMLKLMVKTRGNGGDILEIAASDFMDDGSELKLHLTVDGKSGPA